MPGLRQFFRILLQIVWDEVRKRIVVRGKVHLVTVYLQAAQAGRLGLIAGVLAMVVWQSMTVGLALMAWAAYQWLPWDNATKILALFICGAVVFFAPLIVVGVLVIPRVWYKVSGSERLTEEVLRESLSNRNL